MKGGDMQWVLNLTLLFAVRHLHYFIRVLQAMSLAAGGFSVLKHLSDGSVETFKTRLAVKGFHQRPGMDFYDMFSPVVKHATIQLVIGVAATKQWPLRQLDVNNAFHQGRLTEEVYMSQPPGFIDKDRPNYVWKLHKTIYGLKQAQRAWYNKLRTFLTGNGFINSLADTSLFIL